MTPDAYDIYATALVAYLAVTLLAAGASALATWIDKGGASAMSPLDIGRAAMRGIAHAVAAWLLRPRRPALLRCTCGPSARAGPVAHAGRRSWVPCRLCLGVVAELT
jgi:hypothetical protein